MKTNIQAIQIIVSLLKQHKIRNIVISPGTRHVPFVHCVEVDSFFKCYSVVDERSAAYFALGLSEALDEPVAFACTSSTAACNYMPAMQEAYERGIQLVALTSDKARYRRYHGISQCIDQVNMYLPFAKMAVDTPIVNNTEDYWYCNRCVNEALLELNHHGKGPVQINFLEPTDIRQLSTFEDGEIPPTRKITRVDDVIYWDAWKKILQQKKRILVLCGQYYCLSQKLNEALSAFAKSYNAVITYDNFSNVRGDDFILSPLVGQTMNPNERASIMPDLIITYGSKVYSDLMEGFCGKGVEQWDINPEGRVFDSTKSLSTVFECTPEHFFQSVSIADGTNDGMYKIAWDKLIVKRHTDTHGFTNHYVAKTILDNAPADILVHASVLNSMKFTNYHFLHPQTSAFGNINADGIDGALSTFLGQSSVSDRMALLIVGDLSFIYDLNALPHVKNKNIRILLINNQAGGEFHYNISKKRIDTLDLHIAASHHTILKQCEKITDVKYFSAHNEEELSGIVKTFFSVSDKPIILEAFTDANNDGEALRLFLASNRTNTTRKNITMFLRKILGDKFMDDLKNRLK